MKEQTKKYIIGGIIVTIIILLIIWYRNVQKSKAEALAKAKLTSGGTTPTSPVSTIGRTVVVKTLSVDVLKLDNSIAYTKYMGAFVGNVVAEKTDAGNTLFYKIINTNADYLYVLKSGVKIV